MTTINIGPFQNIVNVGWGGTDVIELLLSTASFDTGLALFLGANASVQVGTGVNEINFDVLSGTSLPSFFVPTGGPGIVNNSTDDELILNFPGAAKSFYTVFGASVLRTTDVGPTVEAAVYINRGKLATLFGDSVDIVISKTGFPDGSSEGVYGLMWQGAVNTIRDIKGIDYTYSHSRPGYTATSLDGNPVDFKRLIVGGGGASDNQQPKPVGSFVLRINLKTLAITDLTDYNTSANPE